MRTAHEFDDRGHSGDRPALAPVLWRDPHALNLGNLAGQRPHLGLEDDFRFAVLVVLSVNLGPALRNEVAHLSGIGYSSLSALRPVNHHFGTYCIADYN